MANRGWDCVLDKVRMPIAGGTVNSEPLTVPHGAWAMTVHCPTTTGPATMSIQTLEPADDDQASETWRNVSMSVTSAVTTTALTAITMSNLAITYPLSAIGGGQLRFVASQDQSGAPIFIRVVFHMGA